MADSWFFQALPCRPAPWPGECLSGYLLRLADTNGFPRFWTLASDLFPRWSYPSQTLRLRWEYPVEDWRHLLQRTQLPLNCLQALTLAPWVAKFRPLFDGSRSNYWSPGLALHGVVTPDLRVCPLCLQTQPYLRLIWRLTGVSMCLEHGCLLQTHCSRCGAVLSTAHPEQRHLHCAICEADLRNLPVVPAPAAVLAAQRAREPELRFLLDPTKILAASLPPGSPGLPKAIGLKFRYLRMQRHCSLADMARQMGIRDGILSELELGQPTPLALYLTYLEALSLSWPDLAALEVPPAFAQEIETPPHLPLRICPTVNCPNHQPPPGLGVGLTADLPARRVARFRCHACGKDFTRSYDGEQIIRPRKPPSQSNASPTLAKPPGEITRLKALGLRGESNLQIAHQLGWTPQTVAIYWRKLGLEERVHQAQARRRTREQERRHATLRAKVKTIVQTMRQQDEEITISRVGRAIGQGAYYLLGFPDLAQYVGKVAGSHNARLRRQRDDAVKARLSEAILQMQRSTTLVKVETLVHAAGVTYDHLRRAYPELYIVMRRAARSHRVAIRTARRQAQREAINAAAARLVARSSRLTYGTILKEAKLNRYTAQCDSTLRDLLYQWVGGFAPHD